MNDPELPPLPTLGPVSRQAPPGGARRHWRPARVSEIRTETARAKTFRLTLAPASGPPTNGRPAPGHPAPGQPAPRLPAPGQHVPGQHYDVRLTAPDGSTAQRSYSIASAPQVTPAPGPVQIELTVERIADGDVSPYLHDVVRVGDELEVRGPFGGWFIWRGDTPVLLVGGGSGVVPLMAMRRYWLATGRSVPLRLVVGVRTPEDLFYPGEYGDETSVIYSRQAPAGDRRPPGRLAASDLAPLIAQLPGRSTVYVCGSAGFAEHASQLVVSLGVERTAVRVERFGPS